VTGRCGKRRKQLKGDLKETREYWQLKKTKHYIALCKELALEEATDL
jgi:hypothetical protein